jgi:hypothetical protein
MPSANIVAQNPAGKRSPDASFGHDWLDCAKAAELIMHKAPSAAAQFNKRLAGEDMSENSPEKLPVIWRNDSMTHGRRRPATG